MKYPFLFFLFTLLYMSCTKDRVVDGDGGGSSSETVAGVVVQQDSLVRLAKNVPVYLYPSNYNPESETNPEYFTSTTNEQGKYQFLEVPYGNYNLISYHNTSGKVALLQKVIVEKSDSIQDNFQELLVLKVPGTLSLKLSSQIHRPTDIFYIPGTPISKILGEIDIAKGSVQIEEVPEAKIEKLVYLRKNGATFDTTVYTNITSSSAQTTHYEVLDLYNKASAKLSLNLNTLALPDTQFLDFVTLLRLTANHSVLNQTGQKVSLFDFINQNPNLKLYFTNSRGKILPYEIEQWDSQNRQASIWLKLDTLKTNAKNEINLYISDSTQLFLTSIDSADIVFPLSQNYAGVWHFNSLPPQIFESSKDGQNSNLGTGINMSTLNKQSGLIADGLYFNGDSQWVSTSIKVKNPNVFSISLWFKSEKAGGKLAGFTGMGKSFVYVDRHIYMDSTGKIHFGVFSKLYSPVPKEDSIFVDTIPRDSTFPGIRKILSTVNSYHDGKWHYVVAQLSPSGQELYLDGVRVAYDPGTTLGQDYQGSWQFGYGQLNFWNYSASPWYQGFLDEVQIRYQRLSPSVIKAMYEMQKPNSDWIQINP